VIDELCKYLDNSDPCKRVFAVDGTDTALTKDLNKLVMYCLILFNILTTM